MTPHGGMEGSCHPCGNVIVNCHRLPVGGLDFWVLIQPGLLAPQDGSEVNRRDDLRLAHVVPIVRNASNAHASPDLGDRVFELDVGWIGCKNQEIATAPLSLSTVG